MLKEVTTGAPTAPWSSRRYAHGSTTVLHSIPTVWGQAHPPEPEQRTEEVSLLSRALAWLDEAAGGPFRLAPLAASIRAVAVYCGDGHLPRQGEAARNAALAWELAATVETHTYVSARHVRAAWQDGQAAATSTDVRANAARALQVKRGALAFLLAFSCWSQLSYLYVTWTPPSTTLYRPRTS